MLMTRRALLIGPLALGACSRLPASPDGPLQPITLEQAFAGRAVGAGVFRVDLTGSERRFSRAAERAVAGRQADRGRGFHL